MKNKLHQRKLFVTRDFEIRERGLKYDVKDLTDSLSVEIPYEEINYKEIRQRTQNRMFIIASIFFFIVLLAKLNFLLFENSNDYSMTGVVFILLIISGLIAYIGNKDYIILEAVNPQVIVFESKRPDRATVEVFLSQLRLKMRDYLLEEYGNNPNITTEERLQNLNWLKSKDLINKKEYEEFVISAQLNRQSPIGFKNNES